jgi:hypothetical protein
MCEVGIATGYGLDDREIAFGIPLGSRISSSPRRPDRLWGIPSLISDDSKGIFSEGKTAGRETVYSPPTK